MRPVLAGIADEAGVALETQLCAIRELGWTRLELRGVSVDGGAAVNVHDLPEAEFARLVSQVRDSGITVHAFASTIANWATKIDDPFEPTLAAVERAIPRMRALGAVYVRIMSFAVRPGEEQLEAERFRRLREIVARFLDAGLIPLHENCNNYGGLSATHTRRLLDEVPGLRLIFDAGNTIGAEDRSHPAPRPQQSAWDFYTAVRDAVDYIHVKDAVMREVDGAMQRVHTWPGGGAGDIRRILADALARGQVHTISIEPHLSRDLDATGLVGDALQYHNLTAYGRRLNALLASLGPGKSQGGSASLRGVGEL